MTTFDQSRALLRKPDMFARFRVPERSEPLAAAGLDPAASLLRFERGGEARVLLVTQMAYHHVAQGYLAGEPYVVTF